MGDVRFGSIAGSFSPAQRVTRWCVALGLAGVIFYVVVASAEGDKRYPDPPYSMGQPKRLRAAAGVQAGYAFDGDLSLGRAFANFTPEGYFPHLGIDLLSVEFGATYRERELRADVGYYVRIPYARFGLEYDFGDSGLDFVFTLQYGLRRGGLFRHGEEIRFDYRGRNKELLGGIVFNTTFSSYRRTRPLSKWATIPNGEIPSPSRMIKSDGLPDELELAIREVEHAASWLSELLTPSFINKNMEENARRYRDHIRLNGHTFADEDARYHRELRRAFGVALEGDEAEGDRMGAAAEGIIFNRVLVPYNGLFGHNKSPRDPTGLVEAAIEEFEGYLDGHSRFLVLGQDAATRQRERAREVFRRTAAAIHKAAERTEKRWRTTRAFWAQRSRLTWLPLNYGLRPEQYDTQEEWDAIVEQVTGHVFTTTNTIEYMVNERFHPELKRMILETDAYHVMIIHDFRGRTNDGDDDAKGWDIVANGYMRALIEAVKTIDSGERDRFPQFMIFIDQNYYQVNKSRPIMTYLENLYEPGKLKIDDDDIAKLVTDTHRELKKAIENSPSLRDKTERELADLFKVHVSVTNPWDPTFAWDIDKRDHRKIAFRDVFEDDPSSGEGILTGAGVGESYQPPGWEDRALGIRGTALLELKRGARELCISQGFREGEVPAYLRSRPFPDDYEEQCRRLQESGWRSKIMIVMNNTGYGVKKATVQRAVTYNLAPPNSVLLAVDSLWLSDFWASMFIAAALRGVHTYAIAPSPSNAPSAANFTMFLARENLSLLIRAREFVKEDLGKVGGKIHVGLYNHDYAVDDVVARASAFLANVDRVPFVNEDFPMHPGVMKVVREYTRDWMRRAKGETASAGERKDKNAVRPFLHMKTQFFATDVGLDILRQEQWVPIVRRFAEIRTKQYLGQETVGMTPVGLAAYDSTTDSYPLFEEFEAYLAENRPDEKDNAIYSFTIGSMNQDRRGMVSDGEVLAVCNGYTGLIGVLDMYIVAVTSAWPADTAELEALFPEPSMRTLPKRLARYLQDFF